MWKAESVGTRQDLGGVRCYSHQERGSRHPNTACSSSRNDVSCWMLPISLSVLSNDSPSRARLHSSLGPGSCAPGSVSAGTPIQYRGVVLRCARSRSGAGRCVKEAAPATIRLSCRATTSIPRFRCNTRALRTRPWSHCQRSYTGLCSHHPARSSLSPATAAKAIATLSSDRPTLALERATMTATGERLCGAVPLGVQAKWTGAFATLWSVGSVCVCGRQLSKSHGRRPGRQTHGTRRCSPHATRLLVRERVGQSGHAQCCCGSVVARPQTSALPLLRRQPLQD